MRDVTFRGGGDGEEEGTCRFHLVCTENRKISGQPIASDRPTHKPSVVRKIGLHKVRVRTDDRKEISMIEAICVSYKCELSS